MLVEEIFRPLITVIRVTPDNSGVEVVLEMEGERSAGYAGIDPDDVITAAARSTVVAVSGLLAAPLRLAVAWAEVLQPAGSERPVVNVGVDLHLSEEQTEHLLGAAYVHAEPPVAAVRATLDGLTRRLAVRQTIRSRPDVQVAGGEGETREE